MKKVDVDISELLKEARDLTEVANRISTNSPDTDIEIFMQHLASYLADFNYWVSKTSSLTLEDPSLKEQIKKEVSELNKAHTLVIEASKKRKTSLMSQNQMP